MKESLTFSGWSAYAERPGFTDSKISPSSSGRFSAQTKHYMKQSTTQFFFFSFKKVACNHWKGTILISRCKQYYSPPRTLLLLHFKSIFNRMLPLCPPSSQTTYYEHIVIIRSMVILHLWTTMSYSNVVWLLPNLNKISFPFCPQANCEILIHIETRRVNFWLFLVDSSNSWTQSWLGSSTWLQSQTSVTIAPRAAWI